MKIKRIHSHTNNKIQTNVHRELFSTEEPLRIRKLYLVVLSLLLCTLTMSFNSASNLKPQDLTMSTNKGVWIAQLMYLNAVSL